MRLEVTVVSADVVAYYSGMLPAVIAGNLPVEAAQINVEKLLSTFHNPAAEFTLIEGSMERIDPIKKEILVMTHGDSQRLLPFDVLALDIGSSAKGLETIPGAMGRVLATRPVGELLKRLDYEERVFHADKQRLVVTSVIVGGGYAGCELAMSLRQRWTSKGATVDMVLATETLDSVPLPVQKKFHELGIRIRAGLLATEVVDGGVICASSDGSSVKLEANTIVFATGAAPHPFLLQQKDELTAKWPNFLTDQGYFAVDRYLASFSNDSIFATGDCAEMCDKHQDGSLISLRLPKSGVVAVRQGTTLTENVLAALEGRPRSSWTEYIPQKSWLQILNCGDGTAIAIWGSWQMGPGKWVMKWKSWIDERWMKIFQ